MCAVNEDGEPVVQQRELVETALTAETDLILTITERVAEITNRSINDLPPLYDGIDGETVTEIIEADLCSDNTALTFGFNYCGCRITYDSQQLRITSL